jgi:hypothetical protein
MENAEFAAEPVCLPAKFSSIALAAAVCRVVCELELVVVLTALRASFALADCAWVAVTADIVCEKDAESSEAEILV